MVGMPFESASRLLLVALVGASRKRQMGFQYGRRTDTHFALGLWFGKWDFGGRRVFELWLGFWVLSWGWDIKK